MRNEARARLRAELQELRQRRPERTSPPPSPVIALTSYAMKGDREKFLENRMDGYVIKPADFGDLAQTIAEVCGLVT